MTANFGPKQGTYDLKNISVFHIKSNGCNITTIPNLNNKIAIVERGGCDFYVKALNIQKKNGLGIIIGNNVRSTEENFYGFLRMDAPTEHLRKLITIPSVFISQEEYIYIIQYIPYGVIINFDGSYEIQLSPSVIDIIINDIIHICFITFITVVIPYTIFVLIYFACRYYSNQAQSRHRLNSINNLPRIQYDEENINEYNLYNNTCAICLENYETNDEILIFRCNHCFHPDCIEPWISDNNVCPICKQPIFENIDTCYTIMIRNSSNYCNTLRYYICCCRRHEDYNEIEDDLDYDSDYDSPSEA